METNSAKVLEMLGFMLQPNLRASDRIQPIVSRSVPIASGMHIFVSHPLSVSHLFGA
jgi:hypothetical protein